MKSSYRAAILTALLLCPIGAGAESLPVPYPMFGAPVVHSGRYHVLSCGNTWVVLDAAKGMSVSMIGYLPEEGAPLDISHAVLENASLHATVRGVRGEMELDQAFDPAARLLVIDQGSSRVAVRVFFTLRSSDGLPHGSGTLDVYVYGDRVHLVPSLYIDYETGGLTISSAGLRGNVPGGGAEMMAGGSKIMAIGNGRFLPFGDERAEFGILLDNPGRASMKIGWSRNTCPSWLYLNEIDKNPETDELYEKWPLWIIQRGSPLSWKRSERSGLQAEFSDGLVRRLDFLWLNGDSLRVPDGGNATLNGAAGVFLGRNSARAEEVWNTHRKPFAPKVTGGEFKYYNEIEGVYEIDAKGGDTEVRFDNSTDSFDRRVYVRFWNLSGKGSWTAGVNRTPALLDLSNDGEAIEDPMVPILKEATGPARFGSLAFTVGKGSACVVALKRSRGMQLAYQMYSDGETYEGWTDDCAEKPLFRFQVATGELRGITLPGGKDFAVAKLPLYWMRNGINNDTFMNHTRGFQMLASDSSEVRFSYTGTNLEGTGLSVYNTTARRLPGRIAFDILAEFTPLDDGKRWSSVEYCDLYPFDTVYRRTFHFRDVIFLNAAGVFDRVGTGAWSSRFKTIRETDRPGYYSEYIPREEGVSRTPAPGDGSVWLLGSSADRGNVLFRRGEWMPSIGASSVFGLCNAYVDVHNTVTGRTDPSSKETVSFSFEIFAGPVPTLDQLNAMYARAAGGKPVKRVTGVKYGPGGMIEGFETK
jgi:hypothetical protein